MMMDDVGAILRYGVLDTASELPFDDIVALAGLICGTPTALVSLLDNDRQWFKARVGFQCEQTSLDRSVCRHVVAEEKTVVIPDLSLDPRTASNPLVTGEPHIRFYAGAPLATRFGVVGALCVIDTEARADGLSAIQQDGLERLARQVVGLLEARLHTAELADALQAREDALAAQRISDGRRDALLALGDVLRDLNDVAEMTRRASEIIGTTMSVSRTAYGEIDHKTATVDVGPGWSTSGQPLLEGRYRFDDYGVLKGDILNGRPIIIADVTTDPRTSAAAGGWAALNVRSVVNAPVYDRGHTTGMLIVHDDKVREWTADELAFVRNAADRLAIAISRRRTELYQDVLNGEIAHRLKNTLAIVQAIASQTLKRLVDAEALVDFTSRLQALGAAHDALTGGRWQSTDLKTVVCRALNLLGLQDRCSVDGPDIAVGARAALSTSMLIHELATNATKYGAFSDDMGAVRIVWRLEGDDAGSLILEWLETGGPELAEPSAKGFGSKLIRLGLVGTGGSVVRYDKTGLYASFKASVDVVGQA